MTQEEQRRHIGLIRDLSRPGGVLDKDSPHASVNNPAWFRSNGLPRAVRRALHARIMPEMGEQLAAADYAVTVVDVEVPFEVSEARIQQRWQEAIRDAATRAAGELGGRWVPSAHTRPLFDTTHGRSKAQDVAEKLADECPVVLRFER